MHSPTKIKLVHSSSPNQQTHSPTKLIHSTSPKHQFCTLQRIHISALKKEKRTEFGVLFLLGGVLFESHHRRSSVLLHAVFFQVFRIHSEKGTNFVDVEYVGKLQNGVEILLKLQHRLLAWKQCVRKRETRERSETKSREEKRKSDHYRRKEKRERELNLKRKICPLSEGKKRERKEKQNQNKSQKQNLTIILFGSEERFLVGQRGKKRRVHYARQRRVKSLNVSKFLQHTYLRAQTAKIRFRVERIKSVQRNEFGLRIEREKSVMINKFG